MRALLAIVLLLLAMGAGIAAASAVVEGAESFEREAEHLLPGPAEMAIGATAPDPSKGPDWAVRTYISRTGLLCAERGRLQAGVFGDVGADGRLEPRPAGPTGTCGEPEEDPVVAAVDRIAAHDGRPASTVVFGASLRPLESAIVRPADAPELALPIGPRSTFIAVFPGLREPSTLPLIVRLRDGGIEELTWLPSSP
jgi:hypothetical protein